MCIIIMNIIIPACSDAVRSNPGARPSEAASVELDGARAGKTAPMEVP